MAREHIGNTEKKKVFYNINTLTRHAAVLGTTGSGKTVMSKVLAEEALAKGIPVIAIDPKGDIGTLGIINTNFDFRPFGKLSKQTAQRTANAYLKNLQEADVNYKELLKKLATTKTEIYVPKSNHGQQLSMMPNLDAPKNFSKMIENDPLLIQDFVEPVSESILKLAGVKNNDRAKTLISTILLNTWTKGENLTIIKLITKILNPDFENIGSLNLDDFMKENDRKKLAASVNLLISDPSRVAWSRGKRMNISKMLSKGTLSVFDLRFCRGQEEKQFVSEQIMQELYRYLLNKGGTEKLRCILYFDELAGFLPLAPSNPPSKKLLELLIRQGRAFGLGVILATQNPGDIDYKILGNVGTRFIGKLRTENDIDKVATATGMDKTKLRTALGNVKTGEFVYNNAVDNKTMLFKARWLVTFHKGPLKPEELRWVTNPTIRPIIKGKINPVAQKKETKQKKKKQISKPNAKKEKTISVEKDVLEKLTSEIKKYADTITIKRAISEQEKYAPHLKIVIEPQKEKGLKLPMKGPFVFDLTAKMIPIGNYLKNVAWGTPKKNIKILPPKRSVKQAFNYAIKQARTELKTKYYESTIIEMKRIKKDKILKMNREYLQKMIEPKLQQLKTKAARANKILKDKIKDNNKKMAELKRKNFRQGTKRFVKKVLTKKNLVSKTKQMKEWDKKIKDLKRKNKLLNQRIKSNLAIAEKKQKALINQAEKKASSCIKKYSYVPARKRMVVHAHILLVPVNRGRI